MIKSVQLLIRGMLCEVEKFEIEFYLDQRPENTPSMNHLNDDFDLPSRIDLLSTYFYFLKSLLKVTDNIIDMLDSYRNTD